MPVDKNGLDLKVGDIVILPCRVTALTGDGYRENDLALETLDPAPNGSAASFEVNSRVVVKGMQIPELKLKTATHLPDSHHPLDINKETSVITPAGGGKVKEVTDTRNLERFNKEVSPNQGRSQETFTQAQDNARAENIQVDDIVKYRTGDIAREMRVLEVLVNPLNTAAVRYRVTDNPPLGNTPNFLVESTEVEKVIKVIQAAPETPQDPAMAPSKTFAVEPQLPPEPELPPTRPVDPPTPPTPPTPQDPNPRPEHKDKPHGRGKHR